MQWFAVVCGGLAVFLTAHGHTDVLSSQILVLVCGGVWWFAVVCGGLRWFVVDCGGLSFSHTVWDHCVPTNMASSWGGKHTRCIFFNHNAICERF